MWETITGVIIGGVIGFLPAWFFSNRSHKWDLEERKHKRKIDAREIRLKEGEEITKLTTSDFYYFMKLCNQIIQVKSREELKGLEKIRADFQKTKEEMDKGKIIYEVSISSLEDEQLNNAWVKIDNTINLYLKFCSSLSLLIVKIGIGEFQKQYDKHVEEEEAYRSNYYDAVEEFIKRINELRSQ